MKKVLLALGFAAVASSAQAYSVSVLDDGTTTSLAGSTVMNFDAGFPTEHVDGGAIFFDSITNVTAKPIGSTGGFYSEGASEGQEGPGIFSLGSNVNYFGFLWGSVDTHNVVTLFNEGEEVFSFTGDAFNPHDGNQSLSIYVNIFGGDGEFFDEIQFSTGGIAFEIDNAGYGVAEVPVPAALPLMASALGLFGLSRRKNKAKVA